jgi:hypothetical protein
MKHLCKLIYANKKSLNSIYNSIRNNKILRNKFLTKAVQNLDYENSKMLNKIKDLYV